MNGRSENQAALNQILWPDAELHAVSIDYDRVRIEVQESTGRRSTLSANGYIGYNLCGFWDEVVIERAEILDDHPLIRQSTESLSRRLGPQWLDSGNEDRNARTWQALVIHLSDGATLEVVASRFQADWPNRS